MTEKLFKLGDFEIGKMKFHQSKKLIGVNDMNIEKMLVSNEFSF